jgi:DNA repair exonuclease SbcCD ATPase subunit
MQMLAETKARFAAASSALIGRKARRDTLRGARDRVAGELESLQRQAEILDKVVLLLMETGKHAREQAKSSLETMVTLALRTVFGAEYSFKIELPEHAGRPTAEFYVTSLLGGEELETRPQESRGGGVVDVVSLGLRVAMLETHQPRIGGPLVLDEPAKHVSDEYIQAVADFLKRLSDYYRRQIILVTHNDHISDTAGVAYRVTLREGSSAVSRER